MDTSPSSIVRVDDAGTDGVEPNPFRGVFDGECGGHRIQPSFRQHRDRRRHAGDGLIRQGRCDIHHVTGSLSLHLTNCLLGHVEKAREIRRDESLEILGRIIRERFGNEDPGVVHQDVDAAEPLDRGADDPAGDVRRCRVTDVVFAGLQSGETAPVMVGEPLIHAPAVGEVMPTDGKPLLSKDEIRNISPVRAFGQTKLLRSGLSSQIQQRLFGNGTTGIILFKTSTLRFLPTAIPPLILSCLTLTT